MKRVLIGFAIFLPIVILVITINYYVDPANLFHEGYEEGVAELLANGMNVENIDNYNERLLQEHYIKLLSTSPEVIVLGSSRSMQVGLSTTREESLFNNCVSGAILKDMIAIYGIYREEGLLPKKIIIGIDPWIFNKNLASERWESIEQYYYSVPLPVKDIEASNNQTSMTSIWNNSYSELFSFSYFQASLKKLLHRQNEYISTNLEESENNIKKYDGTISYGESSRNKTAEEVELEVVNYIEVGNMYGFENFVEIDEGYALEFEAFIDLIIGENVEVELFFPPYHPAVYSHMIQTKKNLVIQDVELFIEDFAKRKNIPVYGSYDAAKITDDYLLGGELFFDGFHPRPELIRVIFQH